MPLAGRTAIAAILLAALSSPSSAGGTGNFAGKASYYAKNYTGRVASGVKYDPEKFTCAHKTLPFGTKLKVSSGNGRSVVVTVNDRGPFVSGRVLDLSFAAARELRMVDRGVITVSAERM